MDITDGAIFQSQYDPDIPPLVLQRNIWMLLHIIISPPIVVAPCQHAQHDPSKTCCRLVYHQKILTQIF